MLRKMGDEIALDMLQAKIKELERQKKGKKEKKSKSGGGAGVSSAGVGRLLVSTSAVAENHSLTTSQQLKKGVGALLVEVPSEILDKEQKAKRLLEEFLVPQITENRRLAEELAKVGEKVEEAEAKKQKVETDCEKANGRKDKLDALIQEVQKQTHELQLEAVQINEREKKARQELAQGFSESINEVKERMDRQSAERLESLRQNEELKITCRDLAEKYEEREKQLTVQQTHQNLELNMLNEELKEKQEQYKKDVEAATALARERNLQEQTVKALQEQVTSYKGKLSGFQGSLNRSTKVFQQYTQERRKMERLVGSLEQEKKSLGPKHEKKMAAAETERSAVLRLKEEAERQCKDLQKERTELLEEIARLETSSSAKDGAAATAEGATGSAAATAGG